MLIPQQWHPTWSYQTLHFPHPTPFWIRPLSSHLITSPKIVGQTESLRFSSRHLWLTENVPYVLCKRRKLSSGRNKMQQGDRAEEQRNPNFSPLSFQYCFKARHIISLQTYLGYKSFKGPMQYNKIILMQYILLLQMGGIHLQHLILY